MSKTSANADAGDARAPKLRKELGLWDVYCIATGAMFSSGFFLLPGLAAAKAGPSAVLAYLLAGALMTPSMLSMAELSTALPRAGGSYYFVDRSLGPAVGAVTGLGTWLALILKSAFALIGIGAYLSIAPHLAGSFDGGADGLWAIKLLALALTALFVTVNVLGARQSTRVQKILVIAILGVLAGFLTEGLWHVGARTAPAEVKDQYTPFLSAAHGWSGLAGTIGLVFISYSGLTKIASISEEVRRPHRNLPLGMGLSLITATVVYVVGVFIMIAAMDPARLHQDLTPVASAAQSFGQWLPGEMGMILVIIAAIAAFASTGNAGVLSASRYPLAMARDKLLPAPLGALGRFHTPTRAILLTGAVMGLLILAMSAEQVAKFGSTFNLLVFALINLAVIVMRESRIESYDPGFRTPLYPWTPIAGMLISAALIVQMGWATTLIALGAIVASALWYVYYARPRVRRYGAVHHVFARLGRYRHPELRTEFREIIKEKGLREDDPYDDIVERAELIDLEPGASFDEAIDRLAESLARRTGLEAGEIADRLLETGRYGGMDLAPGVTLLHLRAPAVERSELTLARSVDGLCVSIGADDPTQPRQESCNVYGLYALASPQAKTGQHLRILAELADRAEDESFIRAWRDMQNPQRLKETLMRDARFLELFVGEDSATEPLVGRRVRQLDTPPGAFLAMIRKGDDGQGLEPTGQTELDRGDHLTFIGEPEAIDALYRQYVNPEDD